MVVAITTWSPVFMAVAPSSLRKSQTCPWPLVRLALRPALAAASMAAASKLRSCQSMANKSSAADEAVTTASPRVVRRSTPRAVASTSVSMLLKAIARPIDTETLSPAPASDAASAAAPATASMLERSRACKLAWPATIVTVSAWRLSARALTWLVMRFSAYTPAAPTATAGPAALAPTAAAPATTVAMMLAWPCASSLNSPLALTVVSVSRAKVLATVGSQLIKAQLLSSPKFCRARSMPLSPLIGSPT